MKSSKNYRFLLLKLMTLIFACVINVQNLWALSLTDTSTSIADKFLNFVDEHEGESGYRSLNIPSGGRSESLGTACTALADDVSFFDYNPAASCILEQTELTVAHNSWISDSAMETLAGTIRFGDFGIGAQVKIFYVPFTEYNTFGERVTGDYYSESTGTLNVSYNFFSGYYFKGLAVGANAKISWRSVPDYSNNDDDSIIEGSGLAQSGAALMFDAGMLLRFNFAKLYASRDPNLNIGLSLLNVGASITGIGQKISTDDPLPTKICAGISYKPLSFLTFTADIKQPLNLYSLSNSEQWSAGAGVAIDFTKKFSLLSGFLLKGANPRISVGSEFSVSKVRMNVNYTFDLTSSLNPVNHISLSAKIGMGDRGRAKRQNAVDKYYEAGLEYYAIGNFSKAIELWKKALKLNPKFDPAKEGLEAAQTSQDLYQFMRDIQSLD